MCIKRFCLILCVFVLTSCTAQPALEPPTTDSVGYEQDYGTLLSEFGKRALNVKTTFTVECDTPITASFSLTEGDEGYTVTDMQSGKSVEYNDDEAYAVAGYLPPYERAYPDDSGGFSCRISGDLAIERLLSGSNFFAGYTAEQVALDGDCLYSVRSDTLLRSYSYEFSVNITDSAITFPARVKYYIEVNN